MRIKCEIKLCRRRVETDLISGSSHLRLISNLTSKSRNLRSGPSRNEIHIFTSAGLVTPSVTRRKREKMMTEAYLRQLLPLPCLAVCQIPTLRPTAAAVLGEGFSVASHVIRRRTTDARWSLGRNRVAALCFALAQCSARLHRVRLCASRSVVRRGKYNRDSIARKLLPSSTWTEHRRDASMHHRDDS